ncbi:MAG: DNA repair protein RadC, partial [Lachnospiraceae bacterium]|nr:DNA repair protein RadC [Lachnospiraceae bacterium]
EKQNPAANQEMPYEKFLRFGPQSLTEGELLAIILRTGTKEKPALELANEVLDLGRFPRKGLLGLHDLSLEELMRVKGIGEVKAVKLKSITELAMRISRSAAQEGLNLNDSETVANYFMETLRHRKTECVYLVSVDAKSRVLDERMISEGSVNKSLINPREIFLTALRAQAVSVILVHNHPSGDPTPSNLDKQVTQTLVRLGRELNIPVLDHVIIGDKQFYSFRMEGELE